MGRTQVDTESIQLAADDIATALSTIDQKRDELESDVIGPLRTMWQGEAAEAYAQLQARWNEASMAIKEMLMRIGQHTSASAEEFLNAEVANISNWAM
jgi:WXG100 family type VII secretion target